MGRTGADSPALGTRRLAVGHHRDVARRGTEGLVGALTPTLNEGCRCQRAPDDHDRTERDHRVCPIGPLLVRNARGHGRGAVRVAVLGVLTAVVHEQHRDGCYHSDDHDDGTCRDKDLGQSLPHGSTI